MDKRTANIAYWFVLSLSLVWAGVLFVAGIGWVRGTVQVRTPNPWYNWQEFTMPAVLLMYLPSTLLGWKRPRTASWLLFVGAGITVIQLLGSNRYNGDSIAAWFFAATLVGAYRCFSQVASFAGDPRRPHPASSEVESPQWLLQYNIANAGGASWRQQ